MWLAALALNLLWVSVSLTGPSSQWRRADSPRGHYHRVQHGQCSYTFVLPHPGHCGTSMQQQDTNALQRDAPPSEPETSFQKLRHLETATENNTQWLLKLEGYIQDSIRSEMAQMQQSAVQNHTVTMLEIGTHLLSQTAEQTRRLTDVEAQVLNQTSRIEIQLLENSLSTNKLEKQLILQTTEINKIQERNRLLERKVSDIEAKHRTELGSMRKEKELLQQLVGHQVNAIRELEKRLLTASSNNSGLQQQQLKLLETVRHLISLITQGKAVGKKEDKIFRDCADALQSGANVSGIYTIHIENMTEHRKVYCDMETSGGGWTVIQRRVNGSTDFQRNWREYKMGFGDGAGEYWLGNEAIYLLTSQRVHSLRIELRDWDGNQVYSLYEKFHLSSEKQNYRLFLKGYSGTAGHQSSLALHGASFSTRDADHDNCHCTCALMLTGGWWFDACGLSNLNGMYYTVGNNIRKLNGIKWHYFRGPSYSLQATSMMIRPLDF
ncbi:angiopoietin-1 [Stegostoma tigrinum]|uniref:angiopoietin-1 n=1 Tax=Stegostoma tigrinum TaxID=3053191 RepID=UPI00202B0E32|nr:angiopoietin-1 [Stegostoma tigrinum]